MIPPSTPTSTDAGALADVHELGTHGLFRLISTALGKRRNKLTSDDTWAIANEIYEASAALRNSAPQETRGDEPVAWLEQVRTGLRSIVDLKNPLPRSAVREAVAELLASLPVSQQSPRLERDEILRRLAEFFSESVHHVWSNDEIADCLTGMIDQAAVPSTSRREVEK